MERLAWGVGLMIAAPAAIAFVAPRSTIGVLGSAISQFLMIVALDYGPNRWRRSILKQEYEGDALEERLKMKIGGGLPMLWALMEMALVNMRPKLCVGDEVPAGIALHALDNASAEAMDLLSLSRPGVPLVLNFGSCS